MAHRGFVVLTVPSDGRRSTSSEHLDLPEAEVAFRALAVTGVTVFLIDRGPWLTLASYYAEQGPVADVGGRLVPA